MLQEVSGPLIALNNGILFKVVEELMIFKSERFKQMPLEEQSQFSFRLYD